MAEFMMIIKADSVSDVEDWQSHIETLAGSGKFRGGSALLPGNPAYEAGGEIEILELTED